MAFISRSLALAWISWSDEGDISPMRPFTGSMNTRRAMMFQSRRARRTTSAGGTRKVVYSEPMLPVWRSIETVAFRILRLPPRNRPGPGVSDHCNVPTAGVPTSPGCGLQ